MQKMIFYDVNGKLIENGDILQGTIFSDEIHEVYSEKHSMGEHYIQKVCGLPIFYYTQEDFKDGYLTKEWEIKVKR